MKKMDIEKSSNLVELGDWFKMIHLFLKYFKEINFLSSYLL